MSDRPYRSRAFHSPVLTGHSIEPLEPRLLLSTINWVNRGLASDRFADTFGANASLARGVIDATIDAWERVITNFNGAGGRNSYDLALSMRADGTDAGGNGGPSAWDALAKPSAGTVELGRFKDVNGDGKGDGDGYYLDPVPADFAEFDGEMSNAFFAVGVVDGQPPMGLSDFYSLAAHEIGHALGFGAGSNSGFKVRTTNTGIRDYTGDGYLYVFNGPSIDHLVTSNNGGADAGSAVHSAHDRWNPIHITYNGTDYFGAEDLMNHFTPWTGRRELIPDTVALILKDSYNYTIDLPQHFGTYYASLDRTTHQLRVRGGTGDSHDTIELLTGGGVLTVKVDLGTDVPATGPFPGAENLPAFVSYFNLADVTSIVVEAGDGDDTVYVYDKPAGTSLSIQGGAGNDAVHIGGPGGNVSGVAGTVSFDGGAGTDRLYYNDANGDFPPSFSYAVSSINVRRIGGASAFYSQLEQVRLYARGGGNTIDIESTAANTPVTVYAGLGNDTIRVSYDDHVFSLGAALSVVGQGGSDTLSIHDDLTAVPVNYTVTSTSVADNFSNQVAYEGLEQLTLHASGGINVVDVGYLVTPVTVNGNGGADLVRVCNGTHIFSLGAALSVNGGDGLDQLTVYDDSYASSFFYVITNTQVHDLIGNAVTYAAMEGIALQCGSGASTVQVQSTASGAPVTVYGNGGEDTFNICAQAHVFTLAAPVSIDGGSGGDGLYVFDDSYTSALTYTINSSDIHDAYGNRVNYSTIEGLSLYCGSGVSTVNVDQTAAAVPVRLFTGGGDDVVTVSETASSAPVCIDGEGGFDTVHVNPDNAGSAQVTFESTQDLALLNIGAGGLATLAAAGNRLLLTRALTIAGETVPTGRLNLTNNAMVVDYAARSVFNTIRNWLKSGYNAGAWNGPGIMSSSCNATQYALGVAESQTIFGAGGGVFAGQPVDATAVLVRYTRYGDANLDRIVNVADLGVLATNWQKSGDWPKGDFDYSGLVNVADLGLLATNWQMLASQAAAAAPAPEAPARAGLPPVSRAADLLGPLFGSRRIGDELLEDMTA